MILQFFLSNQTNIEMRVCTLYVLCVCVCTMCTFVSVYMSALCLVCKPLSSRFLLLFCVISLLELLLTCFFFFLAHTIFYSRCAIFVSADVSLYHVLQIFSFNFLIFTFWVLIFFSSSSFALAIFFGLFLNFKLLDVFHKL